MWAAAVARSLLSQRKRIRETISLPLGAVRLTQEFLPGDPPDAEQVARLKRFVARELRKAERRFGPLHISLVIATSGTPRRRWPRLARRRGRPSRPRLVQPKPGHASTRRMSGAWQTS